MSKATNHVVPKTGFKGLLQNWRSDILAALTVSLVALPLGLAVAEASGAPAIAGLMSAIIGGLVVTLFRGSHLAINGPAAGLITVVISGFVMLQAGVDPSLPISDANPLDKALTFSYVLSAIAIAGVLQVALGLLKLGKIADTIPSSVIQGVMVAIGIIIISSQVHVAMGTTTLATNPFDKIIDAFIQLPNANPFILIIAVVGLILMIVIPKLNSRVFQFFPSSLWVLMAAIPFVYAFNFLETHDIAFMGNTYEVGVEYLIQIPKDLSKAIVYPNFGKIGELNFWIVVVSIALIASIQTLAMAKAVDKLDPYKRKTNLDKDLIGMGLGTLVAGLVGAIPIITVIVRSTVNVHNNAKTKWSNFYHGVFVLIFIILLAPIITKIPKAALAAILIFIGFKLASFDVFKKIYSMGIEQLIFMVTTTIVTLQTDLLVGILVGTLLTLMVHLLLARLPVRDYFEQAFRSGSEVKEKDDGSYELNIKGVASFLSILGLNKLVKTIPAGKNVQINMQEARLVGMTYMENMVDFLNVQRDGGGKVNITGLDAHVSSSPHNRALKVLTSAVVAKETPRQKRLQAFADEHDYQFKGAVNWNYSYLRNFQFFETRPIERKSNILKGSYENGISWEVADITFNEGFSASSEIHHATVQVVFLPKELPQFILEKEGMFEKLFDRIMAFSGYKDIDFQLYTKFSKKFLLMGEKEEDIRSFFTKDVIDFLESSDAQHIECNGEALLIFKKLKLMRTDEMKKMLDFTEELLLQAPKSV